MTHVELVNITITGHSAVLVATLAAYYKYGDRTEIFNKSLQGADDTLKRMRRSISDDLGAYLRPLFENPGTVPSPVLTPSETYFERPVNPVGSELYRENMRDFVEKSFGAIIDCRSLLLAREAWCFFAQLLSWFLLILLLWQVVSTGAIALIEKFWEMSIPDYIIYASVIVTSVFVLLVLSLLVPLQVYHGRIIKYRSRHDSP